MVNEHPLNGMNKDVQNTFILLLWSVLVFFFATTASGDQIGNSDDYRIGVGDKLSISVWDVPELSASVVVRPDGKISFFHVGDVRVEGHTPLEVKKKLSQALKSFVADPDVTVIVAEIDSQDLFIVGEVAKPGRYNLRKRISLMHLLALAGGVLPTADLQGAFVLRDDQRLDVDFMQLLHKSDMKQNKVLRGYDLVYIPNNLEKGITVMGEINRPGIIPYRQGLTLSNVITLSGGTNEFANLSKVMIIKNDILETIDFRKMLEDGDLSSNISISPKDIVIVPRSFW
jgi:polysaccharide export outer membrane protein